MGCGDPQKDPGLRLVHPLISANTDTRTEGYFRLEWTLAVERLHLMPSDRSFLLPVVIDTLTESDALVPDRFLQWMAVLEGKEPQQFIERVRRLLEPTADGRSRLPPQADRPQPS